MELKVSPLEMPVAVVTLSINYDRDNNTWRPFHCSRKGMKRMPWTPDDKFKRHLLTKDAP